MDIKKQINLELQRFTREAQNVLTQPSVHSNNVTDVLETILFLCSTKHRPCPTNSYTLSLTTHCHIDISRQFIHNYNSIIVEFILNQLTVEWISELPLGMRGVDLVNNIFLEGPPHVTVVLLAESLSNNSGYRVNKCIDLLEQILVTRTEYLLWQQCELSTSECTRQLWPGLITVLATLPDRVTARLKTQASTIFYPDRYIPHLCGCMYQCLSRVHTSIHEGQSCSVQFLGQLLGKLAIIGYKDSLWRELLPALEHHLDDDAIWCRICQRLISDIPDRCMEATIVPLVQHITWYGRVVKFLGDSVLNNQKLRFLLTNKLLLVKHYQQHKIMQNIMGYLASSPSTKHLLHKSINSVLDVWGDSSALRHSSYEHHLYLSKAIIIALSFIQPNDKPTLTTELIPKLLSGMQCHLESALPPVRRLGMIVAECITTVLDHNGEQLKFEYDVNEETNLLKLLLLKPEDPGPPTQHKIEKLDQPAETTDHPSTEYDTITSTIDDQLDSDDDLEPYDMSDDVKCTKIHTPVYLRHCMEGLISSEDPEKLESCIQAAEGLIYKHPHSASEIAVEFTKVLLHLQNNYSLSDFLLARHKAMVALAYISPQQVADYLTAEFFERNYNIRQRMDILEVLSGTAQKLSDPTYNPGPQSSVSSTSLIQEVIQDGEKSWRDIVDERIESNTRRFSRASHVTPLRAVSNKFSPVAGHFFFPILEIFDRRDGFLDLLGDDHMLLSRLCYTLGLVIYAAIHTPIVCQMAKSLIEFIWTLRYHPQPAVRQGLLFSMSMMILAVPSHVLFTQLQTHIIDAKTWLEDVVDKDDDTNCKQLAVQCLVLLCKALNKEFSASDKET